MFATSSALALTCCLLTILPSISLAAVSVAEPSRIWSGKVKHESLRKLAPQSGFIADADTWQKLWAAWRPDVDLPPVSFGKELILVGTVSGPNLVAMRASVDDGGSVRVAVSGTEIAGPGFGFRLMAISRAGLKTINGKAVNKCR